jgi:hypothetical protein
MSSDTGGPTRYGFTWGPAEITRTAWIPGRGRVIEITTDHARLQVHVTEAGRKITAHHLEPYERREDA